MNLLVLVVLALTVSPSLSAPTSYGYRNLAVHNPRGVTSLEEASDVPPPSSITPFTYPPNPPNRIKRPRPAPDSRLDLPHPVTAPPGNPPPHSPAQHAHGTKLGTFATLYKKYRTPAIGVGLLGTLFVGLPILIRHFWADQSHHDQTKRTSEVFEGPPNDELMELALGDQDLDKLVKSYENPCYHSKPDCRRFALSTFFQRPRGTLAGSSATSAVVSKDVSCVHLILHVSFPFLVASLSFSPIAIVRK